MNINDKKAQLQKLQAEIQEEEERIKQEDIDKYNMEHNIYVPLATATVAKTIWYLSDGDFKEILPGYYTARDLLGTPTFKKGDTVVLIQCSEDSTDKKWFLKKTDNYYDCIDDDEYGIPSDEADDYLTDIKYLSKNPVDTNT